MNRDDLKARIRAIIDGPIETGGGTRHDGSTWAYSRSTRQWCGCYEGDMEDLYPGTAEEVTEMLLDLFDAEAGR